MAEITREEKVHLVRAVLSEHEALWQHRQKDMRRFKAAYMTDFYKERAAFDDGAQLRVETSDAYNYIEGFIASLFSKAPAVEIGGDVQGRGNKALVKEITNRFLFDQKTQLELASRLALIYPNAFIKLYPRKSSNLLDQVGIRACSPWDVIVDRDANVWNEQRYIGHIYWQNVSDMNERFGRKKWIPVKKENYFGVGASQEDPYDQAGNVPETFLYCKVVELYDFVNGKLYFWTSNIEDTDTLLEESDIPLESADGTPVSPIIPLYYSRVPDQPLDGISAMKRIYDQVYEKNILRSFWANAVRRDTRQFLVREGAIDEEALAKITAGVDGAMIPVDTDNLAGVISVVPSVPISSNHDRYLHQIDQDLAKGSVMAPFTRGEATKSSATEVAALAQYTASEIGRLARERDSMIEIISERYIQALSLVAGDDKEIILVDGVPELITPDKITGKFKYIALDQASTPIAESVRRQQLLQLVPVLSNLGVEQWKIRDEVIRLFDLPRSFSETPEVQEEIGPRGGAMPGGRPDGAPFDNRPESAEMAVARQLGGGRGIKLPPFGSGPGIT
jgi:hypothetical protein|tara:strand:- start:3557 stop:5245 length:1689 start_codon:yes stop_codon:yes gene_type:complete